MAASGLPSNHFGLGSLLQRRMRFDQKTLAGMGERDRGLGLAREQLGAEHRFECADLVAQRRRGYIEPLGGASEMKFLGDRGEISEVAEFH